MYPYPYSLWILPMFTLGFTRHYRATLEPRHDLVSRKIGFSMLNGFYYASPFGALKLMHAIDRIEIFVRDKPRDTHHDCYKELFGINHSTF
jgi:hypothetical protein